MNSDDLTDDTPVDDDEWCEWCGEPYFDCTCDDDEDWCDDEEEETLTVS